MADPSRGHELVAGFFTLTGAGFGEEPRHAFTERCRAAAAAGFAGIGLHADDLPRTTAAGLDVDGGTCSHPGCRRPARRCDLDHTRDHARGGPTVRANLGPGCDRHHPLKHGRGWRLRQPAPGFFVWTSPLRQVYRTRGEPIMAPLPDPQPRPPELDHARHGRWIKGPILRLPDPPTPGDARPPPASSDTDDPPPF